jgi:HEAT repeat protein
VRVESVQLLQERPESDVRDALLYALRNDPNDGVRLKALSGLKAFAGDTEIRRELVQVLLMDDNPGVRTQAIDLLMASAERGGLEKQLAGAFQELLRKENNSYVRQRCERALEDMRASAETY